MLRTQLHQTEAQVQQLTQLSHGAQQEANRCSFQKQVAEQDMNQQNDKLHALQQRLDLETQKLADKDVQLRKFQKQCEDMQHAAGQEASFRAHVQQEDYGLREELSRAEQRAVQSEASVHQLEQRVLDEQQKGAKLRAQVTSLQHQLLRMQQEVQAQLHRTASTRNLSVENEQAEELLALREHIATIQREKQLLEKQIAEATGSIQHNSEKALKHEIKEQDLMQSNKELRRQIQQAVANERAAHEARIAAEQAMRNLELQTSQSLASMQLQAISALNNRTSREVAELQAELSMTRNDWTTGNSDEADKK
jgi:chromosome segregation ATPase